jgi:hypothetical protein
VQWEIEWQPSFLTTENKRKEQNKESKDEENPWMHATFFLQRPNHFTVCSRIESLDLPSLDSVLHLFLFSHLIPPKLMIINRNSEREKIQVV